jgi:hypothetical protein
MGSHSLIVAAKDSDMRGRKDPKYSAVHKNDTMRAKKPKTKKAHIGSWTSWSMVLRCGETVGACVCVGAECVDFVGILRILNSKAKKFDVELYKIMMPTFKITAVLHAPSMSR